MKGQTTVVLVVSIGAIGLTFRSLELAALRSRPATARPHALDNDDVGARRGRAAVTVRSRAAGPKDPDVLPSSLRTALPQAKPARPMHLHSVAERRHSMLSTPGAATNAPVVPLVTGCGRGGTHSAAGYLRACGVEAIHEGVSDTAVAVSWWYALGDPGAEIPTRADRRTGVVASLGARFSPVVHLVRNPLENINSLAGCFCGFGNMTKKYGRFALGGKRWDELSFGYAARKIDFPANASRLLKAALYWLEWNRLAAEHASTRIRVEDLERPGGLAPLVAALGRRCNTTVPTQVLERGGLSDGRDERSSLSWNGLAAEVGRTLADTIRAQAASWGYASEL